ncbi:hypothetical protein V5799_027667 [Amblyomma americanum]|uniref:Uncharacterized protein n=1 Tax=Amblyomma americanum TaxID=6943 RepID=A0AAQ4DF26_AMBAM
MKRLRRPTSAWHWLLRQPTGVQRKNHRRRGCCAASALREDDPTRARRSKRTKPIFLSNRTSKKRRRRMIRTCVFSHTSSCYCLRVVRHPSANATGLL